MLKINQIQPDRIYVTVDDRIVRCFKIGINVDDGSHVAFITDSDCNMKCERDDGVLRHASMEEERDYYRAAYVNALKEWEEDEKRYKYRLKILLNLHH